MKIVFAPRRQHWLQACAQGSVILYWAWHTPFVWSFLPFILAQLVFAYLVDALIGWVRHGSYTLGFGPFPIVFSINLFLWFRPGWFYLQFAMIAFAFLAKEFIRWNRDGRTAHVFNPSAFPLAVASLLLLVTGTSNHTFGAAIADSQFQAPGIYLVIFLVALPGQVLFGVARMTWAAVVTMYAFSLVYFQATGTYFFYDTHIPVPVFLGMHLLFTDPSTSPRSELGRIMFGITYALGTIACFGLLEALGTSSYYDKLLPVPIMNLLVKVIDRLAASGALPRLDPAQWGRALTPGQRNVAWTSAWVATFVTMSAVQGVGNTHPGQYLPFWQNACGAGSHRACDYATELLATYCDSGSGWACNELGIARKNRGQPDIRRSCDLGFAPGCENWKRVSSDLPPAARGDPSVGELPILLRGTKGTLAERDSSRLYAKGCAQGWRQLCG
ncbi:MAG: hypothetical protein EXR93_03725 [Gemmatimonadetes bacterium]|nr:hypothetical protein [Gemmatimonadota bacterium]